MNLQQRRKDRIDPLPKTLRFDSSDSWKAFQEKCLRYLRLGIGGPQESIDYLGWCLEVRASEYYATIITQEGDIGYGQLMQNAENRKKVCLQSNSRNRPSCIRVSSLEEYMG